MVKDLCRRDEGAVNLLDEAVQKGPGRPPKTVDNIHGLALKPDGTSAASALRRLRKSRPDLHRRVIAGELSPHAAIDFKLDAERKLGQMTREMDKAKGGGDPEHRLQGVTGVPTYSSLGLNKVQVHRWQQAADLPDNLPGPNVTRPGKTAVWRFCGDAGPV